MKIITCCKVVPDEEQIKVLPNRELLLMMYQQKSVSMT